MRAVLPEPTGLVGVRVSAVCQEDGGCGAEDEVRDVVDKSLDESTR